MSTSSTHTPLATAASTHASAGPRRWLARVADTATWLTPHHLLALVNRCAVAGIFWMSARTKVDGWFTISDSAYALFREEYKLPLIPPELAAQMATVSEHLFSVLLVLGAVEPAAPVEPVDPAVPLVPPVLPVAPELLLVLPALVSEGVPASFLLHAPSARVATRAASNTEYFILVPLKKI